MISNGTKLMTGVIKIDQQILELGAKTAPPPHTQTHTNTHTHTQHCNLISSLFLREVYTIKQNWEGLFTPGSIRQPINCGSSTLSWLITRSLIVLRDKLFLSTEPYKSQRLNIQNFLQSVHRVYFCDSMDLTTGSNYYLHSITWLALSPR
jgi:hypothetical protein